MECAEDDKSLLKLCGTPKVSRVDGGRSFYEIMEDGFG
jgi:hypothetical protein